MKVLFYLNSLIIYAFAKHVLFTVSSNHGHSTFCTVSGSFSVVTKDY